MSQSFYAVGVASLAAAAMARCETLGCGSVGVGPLGGATAFPCVVVLSTAQPPTILSDSSEQLTASDVSSAVATADAAETAAANTVASARSNLSGLLTQQSAFGTQLQTDISTVTSTGWAALSAADQQAIMLRVLDGFGTVMTAIANHLTVTGIT